MAEPKSAIEPADQATVQTTPRPSRVLPTSALAEAYPPLLGRGLPLLALRLVALNLSARLEYRLDFAFSVLHGVADQVVGFIFIWAVLNRFPNLGGWTLGEVAFLYGMRVLSHGLYLPIFRNLIEIPEMVRTGELDRLLLRPVHPLLLVVTRALHVSALGDLVTGFAMFWVAQRLISIEWTAASVIFLMLALGGGVLIEAGAKLAVGSVSVWIINTERLNRWITEIFSSFGSYPLTIYGRTLRFAFTFVLPVGFVAYYPATVLLRRDDGIELHPLVGYATPIIGLVVFAAALGLFDLALRRYTSTGS